MHSEDEIKAALTQARDALLPFQSGASYWPKVLAILAGSNQIPLAAQIVKDRAKADLALSAISRVLSGEAEKKDKAK